MKKSFLALCACMAIGVGAITSSVYAQASSIANPPSEQSTVEEIAPADTATTPAPTLTPIIAPNTTISIEDAGNHSHESEQALESTIQGGQGTAVEITDKTPGNREFITVQTQNGNAFYLIVDKEKATNNVYMLRAIDERDLYEFVQEDNGVPAESKDKTPFPDLEKGSGEPEEVEGAASQAEETGFDEISIDEDSTKKEADNSGLMYLGIPVAVIGAYFLKKKKSERDEIAEADDYDDVEFSEDDEDEGDYGENEFEDGEIGGDTSEGLAETEYSSATAAADEDGFVSAVEVAGDNEKIVDEFARESSYGGVHISSDGEKDDFLTSPMVEAAPTIDKSYPDLELEDDADDAAPASDSLTEEDFDNYVVEETRRGLFAQESRHAQEIQKEAQDLRDQEEQPEHANMLTGTPGKAFAYVLEIASGGTAPLTWSIENGKLPAGLEFNDNSGIIHGIPSEVATETVEIKVANPFGSAIKKICICIGEPPRFAF